MDQKSERTSGNEERNTLDRPSDLRRQVERKRSSSPAIAAALNAAKGAVVKAATATASAVGRATPGGGQGSAHDTPSCFGAFAQKPEQQKKDPPAGPLSAKGHLPEVPPDVMDAWEPAAPSATDPAVSAGAGRLPGHASLMIQAHELPEIPRVKEPEATDASGTDSGGGTAAGSTPQKTKDAGTLP